MISRKQRIISFVSVLVMMIVFTGSLFFIASLSDHDCSGDDCHICSLIQQCEKLVNTAGCAAASHSHSCAFLFAAAAVLLFGIGAGISDTLISLKVELLD